MTIDKQELQRLCDAATPGPWHVQYGDDREHMCMTAIATTANRERNEGHFRDADHLVAITFHQCYPFVNVDAADLGDADSAFIAAARTAIPELLARVSELEAENERMRDKIETDAAIIEGLHRLAEIYTPAPNAPEDKP